MKIECKIKRPGGSHVELHGTHYHFAPINPADDATPHVADVTDEAHIERFMQIPEGYAPFGETVKAGTPKRPSGGPVAPADTSVEPILGEDGHTPSPEPSDASAYIRGLTIADLKAKLNTFSDADLRAALDAEIARTDDDPRKGFVSAIKAHLGITE